MQASFKTACQKRKLQAVCILPPAEAMAQQQGEGSLAEHRQPHCGEACTAACSSCRMAVWSWHNRQKGTHKVLEEASAVKQQNMMAHRMACGATVATGKRPSMHTTVCS